MLTSCLEKKGFVSVVIERPDSALVAPLVRAALIAEKSIDTDPRMADDVIAICKEEIARMVKKEKLETRPILRTAKSERNKNPIKMRDKESTEVVIDMDPINPVLLGHVPPKISGKDSSDKSNANRRAVGCNDNGKYATISKTKRPNLKHPWKV